MPRHIKLKSQTATTTFQALLYILTYCRDLGQSQHTLIKNVKMFSREEKKKGRKKKSEPFPKEAETNYHSICPEIDEMYWRTYMTERARKTLSLINPFISHMPFELFHWFTHSRLLISLNT